jgi:hypothetical protein
MNGAVPDPLAGLRDYHLPDGASWWPPAPGWWLLLLVVVLALLVLWLRRRRRISGAAELQRTALRELSELQRAWRRDQDTPGFLRAQSALVRRFVRGRYPADDSAGLTGRPWVEYLISKCGDDSAASVEALRGSLGQALIDLPYLPVRRIDAMDHDVPALVAATEALFRAHPPEPESRTTAMRRWWFPR